MTERCVCGESCQGVIGEHEVLISKVSNFKGRGNKLKYIWDQQTVTALQSQEKLHWQVKYKKDINITYKNNMLKYNVSRETQKLSRDIEVRFMENLR